MAWARYRALQDFRVGSVGSRKVRSCPLMAGMWLSRVTVTIARR